MSSLTNLNTKILTAAKNSTVASAAGIDSTKWANEHVFYGRTGYVRGANRGRCPFIIINRATSDYEHLAEPDHFGTHSITYEATIHTKVSSIASSQNSEQQAYDIAGQFLKILRALDEFKIGDDSISVAESKPYGFSLIVSITAEVSYDLNNY